MSYVTDNFDERVISLLKQGGVGLLPADTIYGLSGRALDRHAVEKIHQLKGRVSDKPFIVLISDIKMLDLLSISPGQADIVKKYWPAALSVIFQTNKAADWLSRGASSIAVRLPDYPELTKLINKTGPIISTSANRQGGKPVRTADEAKKIFGDKLDFYVDAGELNNPPSTLAELKDGRLKVVRQGAVTIDEKEML